MHILYPKSHDRIAQYLYGVSFRATYDANERERVCWCSERKHMWHSFRTAPHSTNNRLSQLNKLINAFGPLISYNYTIIYHETMLQMCSRVHIVVVNVARKECKRICRQQTYKWGEWDLIDLGLACNLLLLSLVFLFFVWSSSFAFRTVYIYMYSICTRSLFINQIGAKPVYIRVHNVWCTHVHVIATHATVNARTAKIADGTTRTNIVVSARAPVMCLCIARRRVASNRTTKNTHTSHTTSSYVARWERWAFRHKSDRHRNREMNRPHDDSRPQTITIYT